MESNVSMESVEEARALLMEYGNRIMKRGLVVGPGGNISLRCGSRMYISPSGYAFDETKEEDYVGVDIETGLVADGSLRPSSEVLMHLSCYRVCEDINAVVHTHPPHAIALASSGVKLEPMFPDFVAYVGEVALLEYIIPTTGELADAVGKAVLQANAVLMANHGALTVGVTMKEAFYRSDILEESARILIAARSIGAPRILNKDEVEAIRNLGSEKYRAQLLKTKG